MRGSSSVTAWGRTRPVGRSTTTRSGANCAPEATSVPSAATMRESPSKTSSSWPPTWFTYAMAQPASATRPRSMARRSARRPRLYGDALMFTTTSAPAWPAWATGPSSNHTSSQMETPTQAPATPNSAGGSSPGMNQRCSSKTP